MDNRIYRSRETKMVSGVCGGIAEIFNIDPTIVRLIAVALTVFSGFTFLLVYVACAVIIPLEPSPGFILRRHQQPSEPAPAHQEEQSSPSAQAEKEGAVITPEAVPVHQTGMDQQPEVSQEPSSPGNPEETATAANDEVIINTDSDRY